MVVTKRCTSRAPDRHGTSKFTRCNASRVHIMLTRSITTTMTRNAVIDTPELLVNIFQHLQVCDLVTFRLVSKYFKTTIDDTPQLQTNMFLRGTKHTGHFWMYNRITADVYPFIRGDDQRYGHKWVKSHSVMRPSILNPLLFKTDEEERRPPLKHRARVCESIRFTRRPDLCRTKNDSITHRMLVCQPPVPVVEFQICFNPNKSTRHRAVDGYRYKDYHFRGQIKNKDGVTFGDLIQALRKRIDAGVPAYLPSSEWRVHVSEKRQSKMSRVWMLGAIFANEEEQNAIEFGAEQPRMVSPLVVKMRKPEFLRDVAKNQQKGYGCWTEEDYEFAGASSVEGEDVSIDYEQGGVEMDI